MMRNLRVFVLAAFVLAIACTALAGNYVVVFKSQSLPQDAAERVSANGGQVVRAFGPVGVMTVAGDERFASNLGRDPKVQIVGAEQIHLMPEVKMIEVAEPDGLGTSPTAADVYYYYQWDMRRIGAPAMWQRYPLPNTPTVAVLDVGVMDDHPDLAGHVVVSKATSYCSTPGGPGNTDGYPIYGAAIDFDQYPDWSPGDPCTAVTKLYHPHGTHVAGTIGSSHGGGRVVGVTPDAKIAAYKVFDRYQFTTENGTLATGIGAFDGPIFEAMIDAAVNKYSVINMSLGSLWIRGSKSATASWYAWNRITKYVNRLGIVVVASAGNAGVDLNGPIFAEPGDLSTVISTGATVTLTLTRNPSNGYFDVAPGSDILASYSNYGAAVDIAAPGGDCVQGPGAPDTCYGPYFILNAGINSLGGVAYYWMSGTSMAAPHVAAVAAAVRAMHPDWTPGDVRSFLKETAEPIGPRQWFGAGLVNADRATQ